MIIEEIEGERFVLVPEKKPFKCEGCHFDPDDCHKVSSGKCVINDMIWIKEEDYKKK